MTRGARRPTWRGAARRHRGAVAIEIALTLAASLQARAGTAQPPALDAPNVVEISAQLTSSGQPSAAALATLAAQGYAADVYLAPLTVADAVADEAAIVRGQGLEFVNIPIAFNDPTERDFDALAAALARWPGRRVLVHCQVNMRASSMVFLHRAIVGHEDPQLAYESVAQVWSPNATWRRFIVAMLQRHDIRFEPY